MYQRIVCPRCKRRKLYKIRRGKRRCSFCYYEFIPWLVNGVRLTRSKWKEIIDWFLIERSGLWISNKTGLSKNQVFKVLRLIRQVITKDVPQEVFKGTVEVDETYLGR